MLESAFKVGVSQASSNSTLLRDLPDLTPRRAVLENWRKRNGLLDGLFYDVSVVSDREAETIGPVYAREGTILIVPPSGQGDLSLCITIEDFIDAGGEGIDVLAIAGVGSSALGAAAFSRNVADALGRPVAAVVSGYGLADLATEALGGFFLFGQLNGLRHLFEPLDAEAKSHRSSIDILADETVRKSHDMRMVASLLAHPKLTFNLLTGHSKGNLVLSEALYAIKDADMPLCKKLAKTTRIVTVSALIGMPRPFVDIIDVIGDLDWFGRLNSRLDIRPDVVVTNAWHHTNPELPLALKVSQVFADLAAAGRLG